MVVATAVAMARPVLVSACGSSSVEEGSRVVMLVTPWGLVVVESGLVVLLVGVRVSGSCVVDGLVEFGVLLADARGLVVARGEVLLVEAGELVFYLQRIPDLPGFQGR